MSKQSQAASSKAAKPKTPAQAGNTATAAENTETGRQPEEPAPAKAKKQTKPGVPDFLQGYIKSYPGEKAFHVTSDRQVFLDKDYNLAKLHQNSLGKGELKTYNL